MVLSRFWITIISISIVWIFFMQITGQKYSIDYVINGEDTSNSLLISESYLTKLPSNIQDSLLRTNRYIVKGLTSKTDTVYTLEKGIVKITSGRFPTDGILPTCKNTVVKTIIPLIAYLVFFCGLMQLLIDSGASEKVAKLLSPLFVKIFPEIPRNHPAISYMTLNFAANFLGLDSAATPFGLKAMESLQGLNEKKDEASNSQIMFMCLHAAGLTLIPTSIIGYRASQHAQNPADVMLPCIITSFVGTLAALIIVGIKQKINFKSKVILLSIGAIVGILAGLMFYISGLDIIGKNHFTNNISNFILLILILWIVAYSALNERRFTHEGKNIFSSFVDGAMSGLNTGITVLPYILGIMVAISLFRNSGAFDTISQQVASFFHLFGIRKEITDSLPVAILRPFSSSGSRGFLIDAMKTYGADSFTGRLSSVFQCSAETTFYVIAVYFGSVKIKNTRYTLPTMLLIDLVCIVTAILVCLMFF